MGTVPMDEGRVWTGPCDVDPPAIDGGSSPSPDGGVGNDSGSRGHEPRHDTGSAAGNLTCFNRALLGTQQSRKWRRPTIV